MGKITNIILNSMESTGTTGNANYYIDWGMTLKDRTKYKLRFNYTGTYNYINSFRFPYIQTNIPVNNYGNKTATSYILGNLKFIMSNSSSYSGNFQASYNDNFESYLYSRPLNNNLNIQLLDNLTKTEFYDESITDAGVGTATQAGNIINIATLTSGIIYIGTVITISSIPRTVIGFITGTGGTGKYQVDISATVASPTAFTFPLNMVGGLIAPYVLILSFEEIEENA